jgi:hypothetical protein
VLGTPQKLFDRAAALGFECITDQRQHLIRPASAGWHLVYRKGHWVLVVNDTPQMHFGYDEVMAFLDRFATPSCPLGSGRALM